MDVVALVAGIVAIGAALVDALSLVDQLQMHPECSMKTSILGNTCAGSCAEGYACVMVGDSCECSKAGPSVPDDPGRLVQDLPIKPAKHYALASFGVILIVVSFMMKGG